MSVTARVENSASPVRPQLARARSQPAESRRMHAAALRIPLVTKLLGANGLALAIILAAVYALPTRARPPLLVLLLAAVAALVVFGVLAAIALLPLRSIESVASRVWRGDFGARVGASAVADRDMKRIGRTFNLLLDGLIADRTRMQALATSIIEAGDRERATLARELHDSTAQQLAALVLELSAAARDCDDPALANRLEQMGNQARAALEEVRLLAHTVHPRVLDDLGLAAALKKLAREAASAGEVEIEVVESLDGESVPSAQAAVLYRIAQSAVHNVLKHAHATHAELRLSILDGDAVLEVIDDGRGFDIIDAEQRRPGMGLFTMRERIALAGGQFDVRSEPGSGTHITAAVPLAEIPTENHGASNER